MADTRLLRSYLYAPGSSERLLSTVLDHGADAVVLDLEDSVPAAQKDEARGAVVAFIDAHLDVTTEMHVRVNRGRFGFAAEDVRAVVRKGVSALRLPRCEDPRDLRVLHDVLSHYEAERDLPRGSIRLYPTIETARGLFHVQDLAAAARVARLCFGAADFLTDIGARGGHHYRSTLYARSKLVVASRVAGIGAPVDSVHTNVDDLDGLRAGAEIAHDLGFFGKTVIDPRQIPDVHAAFTPTDEEITWARQLIDAFEAAQARGEAVLDLAGELIDPGLVGRARGVVALSDLAATGQ